MARSTQIYLVQAFIILPFLPISIQWEKIASLTVKDNFYYCHDSVKIDDLVTFDHCESYQALSNNKIGNFSFENFDKYYFLFQLAIDEQN